MEVRQDRISGNIGFDLDGEVPDVRVVADTDGSWPPGRTAPARTATGRVRRGLMLRNVGLLWIALGAVMTALGVTSGQGLKLSVWLWLGAACYAAYRFHNVRAAAAPTDQGHARLIPDAEWQRILGAIETRRAMPGNVHDLVPRTSTLQQYRDRFAWQHQQGRLSDAELQHRLATLDALAAALEPARK